jgi:hypothetical protein
MITNEILGPPRKRYSLSVGSRQAQTTVKKISSHFKFLKIFEKEDDREELHYLEFVAENREEASKMIDKHDFFGLGNDVSWSAKTKWSSCTEIKRRNEANIVTDPRILSYQFVRTVDDDDDHPITSFVSQNILSGKY